MTKLIQIDLNKKQFSVVEVEDSLLQTAVGAVEPMIWEDSHGVFHPLEEAGFPNGVRFISYSEKAVQRLEELQSQKLFIKEGGECWDDDYCETTSVHNWTRETDTLSFFLDMCEEAEIEDIPVMLFRSDLVQELCSIKNGYADYFDGAYTEEELKAQEVEKKRLKIERTASWWSRECGYPVGSREYVLSAKKVLQERLDNMDEDFNCERKAERFAACRYAGCPDSFWSDEDFIRGRHLDGIEELGMVLQWLEENCPLLMRQVEEAELAAVQED